MSPGPIPNHSSDLSRSRDANRDGRPDLVTGERLPVSIPRADPSWHPAAKRLYNSVKTSGQAEYYQNSDWALLWALCDDMSHFKSADRRSAQMAATVYAGLGNLLLTEGERRKARIELALPTEQETPASVTAVEDYKRSLGLVQDGDAV